MKPLQIRAALLNRGYRNHNLSKMLDVSEQTIHNVIYGRSTSARAAREISRLTGIPVSRLWPGRYPQLEARERTA